MDPRRRTIRVRRLAAALLPAIAAAPGDSGASASLPRWLAGMNADITISVESVSWRGWDVSDVDVPLAAADGRLAIDGGRAHLGSGRIEFSLHHDPAGKSSLRAHGTGLEPAAYPALAPFIEGVPLTLGVDLHSTGASFDALARGATGSIQARSSGGGRLLRAGDRGGDNLLAKLLSSVLPFASDARALAVECVALRWTFQHGRAREPRGAALRTARISVTGGGDIDLGGNSIRVALRPRPRAGIDPAGLALAETVWIEGSLAAPAVRIDQGGLLGRAATFGGGAIATLSGARLLGTVVDTGAPSLCDGAP